VTATRKEKRLNKKKARLFRREQVQGGVTGNTALRGRGVNVKRDRGRKIEMVIRLYQKR